MRVVAFVFYIQYEIMQGKHDIILRGRVYVDDDARL